MTKIRGKYDTNDNKNRENDQLPPWCSKKYVVALWLILRINNPPSKQSGNYRPDGVQPKAKLNSTLSSDKSNILNITNGRLKKFKIDNRKRVPRLLYVEKNNKCNSLCCFVTKILIAISIITATYLYWNDTQLQSVINLMLKSKLKESLSVSEECHARLTQLQAALSRTEYALKRNWRRNGFANKKEFLGRTTSISKFNLIEGATISIGPGTKEWAGGRAMLWGVIPLWKTTPSPYTILATKKLTPGDCWPFIGSHGKVTIELPRRALIKNFSIEHIRPDSANSAPRHFSLHVLLENGTSITNLEEEYKKEGNSQQLYDFHFRDPLKIISFQVLSNHGNENYTCIYRLHLFGQYLDTI